jgi:hypothetical protein
VACCSEINHGLDTAWSHSLLHSSVLYCVDSLILAAVCSADFSNVLST